MFGQRGEGWVAVQAVLFVLYVLAPHLGTDWPYGNFWSIIALPFVIAGLIMIVSGSFLLGRFLTALPYPVEGGNLVTTGAFALVRHPLYSGLLWMGFGFALLSTSWLRLGLTIILGIFFDAKSRQEEFWLVERYPEYVQYRRRVKKLIPWVY
jgi:protein-S-isoprenylcysteine O-methyltransferase Ste14